MKPDQNPFSIYDFLGYFIPGATCVFLYRIFDTLFYTFDFSKFKSSLEIDNTNLYIPFIIASYLLGHVLSILSSYTIEKYSFWANRYPSFYLLNKDDDNWCQKYFENIQKKENRLDRFYEKVKRVILILILLPMLSINFMFYILFRFNYSTYKGFSDETIEYIKEKKKKYLTKLGLSNIDKNHDEFLFIYHFVLENNKGHSKKIQNYVALFGYVRCTSLIFNLASWYVFVINYKNFVNNNCVIKFDLHILTLSLLIMFLSYLFYVAFLKFYKKYAQETLMAFSVIDLDNINNTKTEDQ